MKAKLGYSTVEVFLSADECVDGEYGHYAPKLRSMDAKICLHPDQKGVDVVDSIAHEFLHHVDRYHGLEMPHNVIFTLANSLAELFVSSGLVKPTEIEARLHRYAKGNKRRYRSSK